MLIFYFIFIIKSIDASTQGRGDFFLYSNFNEDLRICIVCNGPLGMISGEIRDWQITASSTFWDPDCHEKNARLYQSADRAWCARHKSDSEWLQIDLGIAAKVR